MKIRSRLALITIALLGTTATLVSCGGEKAAEADAAEEAAEDAADDAAEDAAEDTAEDMEEAGE